MSEQSAEHPAPAISSEELRELVDAARFAIWVIDGAAVKDGPGDRYWHDDGGGGIVLNKLKSIVPRVEEIVFGPQEYPGGRRSFR